MLAVLSYTSQDLSNDTSIISLYFVVPHIEFLDTDREMGSMSGNRRTFWYSFATNGPKMAEKIMVMFKMNLCHRGKNPLNYLMLSLKYFQA